MVFDSKLICFVLSNSSGLSTEGRFLLLCLMYEYSLDNRPVDVSVDRLVKQYGVTRTVCSQLTKYLASSENKMVDIRRTKIRVCDFDSASLSKLSADFHSGKQANYHHDIIVNLLIGRGASCNSTEGKKKDIVLLTSNILLLVILLVHSNSSGSVENLSKSKIRMMMGDISDDRLDSQLKKLNSIGYVFISQNGGTGRKLFGKVFNNYLLNLGRLKGKQFHQEITNNIFAISILSTVISKALSAKKFKMYLKRMEKKEEIKSWGEWDDKEAQELYELLGGDVSDSMSIIYLIINKCESIVSVILTKFWDELDVLKLKDCSIFDDKRIQKLVTRGELFSGSFIRDNLSFDESKTKGGIGCSIKYKTSKERKQAESVFKQETIITNDSFKRWVLTKNDTYDGCLGFQAHQIIDFLLTQSLSIARKLKKILVQKVKVKIESPDYINVAFNNVVIRGYIYDRYDALVTLKKDGVFSVYSLKAVRDGHRKYNHVVTFEQYQN